MDEQPPVERKGAGSIPVCPARIILQTFVRFLRECFGVDNENIKIYIAYYADDRRRADEDFWLGTLELPRICLGNSKTIVSKPKAKSNRHQHGGCTVQVCKTEIVQRIFGAIKQYIGIDDDLIWLG